MSDGRESATTRRRQRVIGAINAAISHGEEVTVSAIARTARVDRSFLYRHRDLLERVHSVAVAPSASDGFAAVTRASLQADLANALERNARLALQVRRLEKRLSEILGNQIWHESGLGSPIDVDQLQRQIVTLEQQVVDQTSQLDERAEELQAARAANRELTRALNHGPR
ncbi:DUF6262 family protein [Streptomyces sp. NPDC002790]|uniref:DUF6262 family protein n=1 Tax=Streptomyces sp. NPDC002790 TaxID=3154431 RepID=UPI0033319AE9